jgi:hypothetical protein
MAAASPTLVRRAPLLGSAQRVHRQTGLLGDVSLSAASLDPCRSDGTSERKLMRWATDRTGRHGAGRYVITVLAPRAPQLSWTATLTH